MERPTPKPTKEQMATLIAAADEERIRNMSLPESKPSADEIASMKEAGRQEFRDNRQRVINHLKKRGLSNAAIAGIVGNIDVETGGSFDYQQRQTRSGDPRSPNIVEGGGYGLFQFDDPGRRAGHETWYKQYLEQTNKEDSTESQLDYFLDMVISGSDSQSPFNKFAKNLGEVNASTLKAYLETSTNPTDIADAITDRFEFPGIMHSDRRRSSANETFAELSDATDGGSAVPDALRGAAMGDSEQYIDQPGNIEDTGEGPDMDTRSTYEKIKPYVPILRHFYEGGMSTEFNPDIKRNYPVTKEMMELMENMTEEERRRFIADAIARQQEGERRMKPLSEDAIERLKGLRRNYNEGGIAKQMELFEDGGLKDEGGTTDPVSGNDVPPGSTQEEVRDDIPAQLSEGEFVFPADVVRYIGLEKLMQMRQEAKMGLQMMEDMGQMGNSDEAVMPDDIPFDLSDLDMEDDLEYNIGGFVPAQPNQLGMAGTQPSAFAGGVGGYTPYQMPQYSQTPMAQAYTPAQQQFVPTQPVPTTLPTPAEFLPKTPTDPEMTTQEYINPETGEKRVITFVGGQPTIPIPAGFISMKEYEKTKPAETKVETAATQTTRVTDQPDPGKEDLEAARRRAEEEKYGVGGAAAKLGMKDFFGTGQDYIYGVNYLDGLAPGPAGIGQILTGKIPDDATILLKNDNDEVLLTGAEYKIMSKEVKAPGTNYSKTRDIIDAGRVRAGEAAQQRFLESLKDDDDDKKDDATKYTLTEKQLDDYAKSYSGVTDFSFGDSSPPPTSKPAPVSKSEYKSDTTYTTEGPQYRQEDPSPDPRPANQYDFPTEKSTREDRFGEAGKYMKDGGLAAKKKPKTKKMKRGGLASKK